ncbi:hypothetical protein C9374_009009 [Naegleria lovaniensis]|uniref:Uncharacterized protein n=1 Tax=Naegleria lovaniensis TaxID=51637 RepID=A0AA88KKL0_NAELO|nr:uncharacterized protein C9374_009009 [Naegleria lovaniensis]KAG2377924.1 hypothetical protein C9374_009009 [Naegleria lovaniensis]
MTKPTPSAPSSNSNSAQPPSSGIYPNIREGIIELVESKPPSLLNNQGKPSSLPASKPPINNNKNNNNKNTKPHQHDFDSDSDEESLIGGSKKTSSSGGERVTLTKQYIYEFHQHRPCRDFLFLLLFIAFCLGMIIIAFQAVAKRREYINSLTNGSDGEMKRDSTAGYKASIFDIITQQDTPNNINGLGSYFAPSWREMTRLFYPTDFLGRVCGVDYSSQDHSVESLEIENRATLFADSLINRDYWKEDLSSRRYLWVVNEKELFSSLESANFHSFNASTELFENWIKFGGVCVESCPSGVTTLNNVRYHKNNNNEPTEIQDEFSGQSSESASLISDQCPPSLRQTTVEKVTQQVQAGNTTTEKVVFVKKEICASKRYFFSNDGKPEAKFFEVTTEREHLSLMGRCIPLLKTNKVPADTTPADIQQLYAQQKETIASLMQHISSLSPVSYFSNTISPYLENLPTLSTIEKTIDIKQVSGLVPSFLEKFMVQSIMTLYNSWKIVLIAIAITAGISFICVVLLRVLAKPLIYGTVGLLMIGWFSLSITLLVEGASDLHFQSTSGSKTEQLVSYLSDLSWEKSLYIATGVLLLLTNLLFTFLFWTNWRKTLSRAVSIISESAMIITTVPQMFSLFPIVIFIIGLVFCVWWFFVVALLFTNELTSAGIVDASSLASKLTKTVVTANDGATVSEKIQSLSNPTTFILTLQSHLLKGWFAYFVFGFFWVSQFLLSFVTIVVARVTSQFYFKFGNVSGTITRARRGESSAVLDNFEKTLMCLKLPVSQASLFVMFYNAGSVALASLFVGLVKYLILVIKTTLSVMGYQQEKASISDQVQNQFAVLRIINYVRNNFLTRFVQRILFSLLRMLEKFMEFFARNALIHCAIFGTSFFHSSLSATKLMRKNITVIAVLEWITDWIMFCMKMVIAVISVCVAYTVIHSQDASIGELSQIVGKLSSAYNEQGQYGLFEMVFGGKEWLDVNRSFLLLIFVFSLSLFVSSLFITIFQTVIDTVLQCYLIDLEMYRKSGAYGDNNSRISSAEMIQLMEKEKEKNYMWLEEDNM